MSEQKTCMSYQQFRTYCVSLMSDRMHQSTAESLFDWIFPEECKDIFEKKLQDSDEFLEYAIKVLSK